MHRYMYFAMNVHLRMYNYILAETIWTIWNHHIQNAKYVAHFLFTYPLCSQNLRFKPITSYK